MNNSPFTRRTYLALGGGLLMASTAGCTDRIPFMGEEPMEFESSLASVPQDVLDETGYEKQQEEAIEINETFEAAGRSQEVLVTNWQAEYDKSLSMGPLDINEEARAAVFTALTTPQVSVLGRSFNPVADMSSEDLAEMVQDRFDDMEGFSQVDEDSVTIAGESTTVGEFEGEADVAGIGYRVDITLHIAEAVESGDDLIVGVGGYPTELQSDERENIFTLLESIEH